MGMDVKLWWAVLWVLALQGYLGADGRKQVPCYFIFGDSLADNGNNNLLNSLAKANYSPYGIDFPFGPTGRFNNGRTTVDGIAQLLGFKNFIPPFARVRGTDILFGVNYASGSAGILDESGKQLGDRVPFDMQLENHRKIRLRLVKLLGTRRATDQYLSKCLYTVGFGNNDFINNYFLPQYYNSSREYTLEGFTDLLIERYAQQIMTLYIYGATKIALFGTGQLGCTPSAISTQGKGGYTCVEIMEKASLLFNGKLKLMVQGLNANISDAVFTYINYYSIGADSSVLGFTNVTAGCCPVASDGLCIRGQIPCRNRTAYAFWDSVHPTEAVNLYIAKRSVRASNQSDAYPFDIQTLLHPYQEVASAAA